MLLLLTRRAAISSAVRPRPSASSSSSSSSSRAARLVPTTCWSTVLVNSAGQQCVSALVNTAFVNHACQSAATDLINR
jgi:hypothetical protein